MSSIYLLNYNNYYNRVKKRQGDSPSDYSDFMVVTTYNYQNPITNYNFNERDGLNTEIVINWFGNMPNYVLVAEVSDSWGFITSRWFVTRTEFTTANQHKLYLKRDVIADYMDSVKSSVAYIRRANLTNDNPLIYNSEGLKFNQIKRTESLLYDKTLTPWLVGYIARNYTTQKTISIPQDNVTGYLTNYDEIVAMTSSNLRVLSATPTLTFNTYITVSSGITNKPHWRKYTVTPGSDATVQGPVEKVSETGFPGWAGIQQTSDSNLVANVTKNFSTRAAQLKSAVASYVSNVSEVNTYAGYNGRVVRSPSGQFYKIIVTNVKNETFTDSVRTGSGSNALYDTIQSMVTATDGIVYKSGYNPFYQWCSIRYTASEYQMKLEEVKYTYRSVQLRPNTAQVLTDAPYFMFAMKYTPDNLRLAIELAKELTSTNVYDIQILPYCPEQGYYNYSTLNTATLTEGKDYERIKDSNGATVDYLIWCKHSSFTFDITHYYTVSSRDLKVENECEMWRLCSPNGNGAFEFNMAKNGGLQTINVDCTYKPINPYIHLNPNFKNLYGQDFNDFRGLILQGDFSIPTINDAWREYEIANKNYQDMFNREIQHLDKIYEAQRVQQIASGVAGAVGAGVQGGITGGMVGGPIGAGIGAGIGLLSSGIGAYYDMQLQQKMFDEQKSYKQDMFKYQLQNVQALPYSISKTGCMTNNNKLVPYLEYYSCTEKEKDILRNLIRYTGCTVGAMGKISDYIVYNSDNMAYIEGDLVEINLRPQTNGGQNDYSIIMAIADELSMGIRFENVEAQ